MNNDDYKEALFYAASIFNERLGAEFSEMCIRDSTENHADAHFSVAGQEFSFVIAE